MNYKSYSAKDHFRWMDDIRPFDDMPMDKAVFYTDYKTDKEGDFPAELDFSLYFHRNNGLNLYMWHALTKEVTTVGEKSGKRQIRKFLMDINPSVYRKRDFFERDGVTLKKINESPTGFSKELISRLDSFVASEFDMRLNIIKREGILS